MRRLPAALACVLLVAACGQTNEQFDMRLREMAGIDERGLLGSMGRIPDNSYQLDDDTKVLQWRWDTSYISPGMPPSSARSLLPAISRSLMSNCSLVWPQAATSSTQARAAGKRRMRHSEDNATDAGAKAAPGQARRSRPLAQA